MKINKITLLTLTVSVLGHLCGMEDFGAQADARAALNVQDNADANDIRKAFYANAKAWWCSNEKNSADALSNIQRIVQAYGILSNDEKLEGSADFHRSFSLDKAFNLNEDLNCFVNNPYKFINFLRALKNKIDRFERQPEVICPDEQGQAGRSRLTRASDSLPIKRPWKLFGITLGFVMNDAQHSSKAYGSRFEPCWQNIFKTSTFGVFTPLAIYFSIKNYSWLYAKFAYLMFK